MSMTEIIVLVLGILLVVLSYILPVGKKGQNQNTENIGEEQIREMVRKEISDAKTQIQDIVDETITYSMEKTERSMERLTNEKIMAVNEYSDTVLEQINKNHKEAVFLYDMLNDKHDNLKETVSEAVKTATEVKQSVKEAEFIPIKIAQVEDAAERILAQFPEVENVQEDYKENDTDSEIMPEEVVEAAKMDEQMSEEEVSILTKQQKEEKAEKAGKVDISSIAAPGKGGRNSNERILELHKSGKSNMAIAKELGLGIGEVKLVIDLFEGI